MTEQRYRLSRGVLHKNHFGHPAHCDEGQIFHWNGHRFVCVETGQEIARSKVYAAGAKMVPVDSSGNPINFSLDGPVVELPEAPQPMPSGKVVFSA